MRTSKDILTAIACVCAVLVTAGAALGAAGRHPDVGKLPGFPAMRGVVPALGSQTAVVAREALVKEAFAQVKAHRANSLKDAPVSNEFLGPKCAHKYFETQEVCYQGGPVLRDPKIHLIFWQGVVKGAGPEAQVEKFPPGYEETIERYFADLAHDSGLTSNVFAVDGQYYSEAGGRRTPGRYAVRFYTEAERVAEEKSTGKPIEQLIFRDTEKFPSHSVSECGGASVTHTGEIQKTAGPCLLDVDLHNEVTKAATGKWTMETIIAGSEQAGNLFIIITPPGVGGCFTSKSSECAYSTYCAYHGDFGGDGERPEGQSVYANIPYVGGVGGCEFFRVRPTKIEGADAAIDTVSHEINESITDPLGSQCNEEGGKIIGCEPFSWTDSIGQEIADKCLPPESTILGLAGIYGEPLGGESEESLYNQVIDVDHYWTQREWSNSAAIGGACVQRIIHTQFTPPAGAMASVPVTFDGSSSGEGSIDPINYWVWSWGEGMQTGTYQSTVSHTYTSAGKYRVTLTAYDIYGNSNTYQAEVEVGGAPPPTPPTPPLVIKEVIVPGHYTPAQVAAALGLPANGKKLSGFGPFSLGRAQCPPACGVTLQLYARETKVSHKRRTSKWVLVGTARVTVAAKAIAGLTLSLNAKGKALLHKARAVPAKLVATVEGQEGGSWQIERTLTLTGRGKAARRARR